MRQRAALLRTFLAGRDVLLLDEPFGALDALTREAMREWLLGVWEADRKTILLVTHDVERGGLPLRPRLRDVGRPGRVRDAGRRWLCRGRAPSSSPPRRRSRRSRTRLLAPLREEARPRWGRVSTAGTRLALALGGRLEPRPRVGAPGGIARRVLPPLLFGVRVLGLWQRYVAVSGVRESMLPSPVEVARALALTTARLLLSSAGRRSRRSCSATRSRSLVGVALAAAVSSSRVVERAIYPWLVASQMVPIPALAPVVVLWTGFDIRPKLIVIALVTFFPIAVNTIDGLRATDPELVGLLRTLGAGRGADFPHRAPARPRCPTSSRGCASRRRFAVIGAVFAEWAGLLERPRAT